MENKTKFIFIIAIPLILVIATATYFNRDTYVATPVTVVEISDEQKLANHLAEVMQEQTASREVTARALVALEESLANDEMWDIEVENAITNVRVYQGIE